MDNLNTSQNNTQLTTILSPASNQKQHSTELKPTGSSVSNVRTLAAAAGAAVNKMRKTIKSSSNKNQQVATTLPANKKTAIASPLAMPTTALGISTASSTTLVASSSASSSANTNNLSISNTNNNNNGSAVTVVNNNTNKNFQIPSDILDDLATRFIINVPDMELNNLIRVCFQIELAHWFYLDFFCSPTIDASVGGVGDTDLTKVLQPLGLKYFAMQLFKHIPFLCEHLPTVDKILEDWKNYKLSVPTYGAILISEDLQYCLLVQSYFAKTSWGFPKGKVNETEDPEHCATREVFEETGFDITNLIMPKDYIEAIINYQYTRLYIVCNVPFDTVFSPRTRNEIRSCNWFPIDCLPNNKNDAISKAKLGQNANSFFMILPFVKRLKKWVNEKRVKAGMLELGAVVGSVANIENNTNTNINNSYKIQQSRKYSNSCNNNTNSNVNNNGGNNAAAVTLIKGKGVAAGAIPKSSSTSYVSDVNFIKNNRKVANTTANVGGNKKQRQQQQQAANNGNVSSNVNRKNINNVTGLFILSDVESSKFAAASAITSVDTATNARSKKRQRHKSMGDLDNMKLHNNANDQSNSCNKNSYKNHNQNNQQQQQQQQQHANNNNKRNAAQKIHGINNFNESTNNSDSGSTRRQLFHSQSQNDCGNNENYNCASDKNCIEQQICNTFDLIRQKKHQGLKKKQQHDLLQNSQETSKINKDYDSGGGNGGGDCDAVIDADVDVDADKKLKLSRRQRAKSQSDKQQQHKQVYFCSNNVATATSSQTNNVQRQRSMITTTKLSLIQTTTKTNDVEINTNIDNTKIIIGGTVAGEHTQQSAEEKQQQQQQQQRYQRYTTMIATNTTTTKTEDKLPLTGNDLISWTVPRTLSNNEQQNITKTTTSSKIAIPKPTSTNAIVEASAIESRLIQEQKLLQQLKITPKREQQLMLCAPPIQQQQKNSEMTTIQQQQHHNPLQHSTSTPGLATWKNFSFTKNLISNVFL